MKRPSASGWMHSPNYGRAIASRAARLSARYYRVIIAILVVALLALEALRTSVPLSLKIFTVAGIVLYLGYVAGRLLFSARWERRYYTPRVQFWRAQAGIAGLTLLLACYAVYGHSTSLWMLYLLAVMIVSEHCSTPQLLLTLIEIGLILIGLGYRESNLSLPGYLGLSSALAAAVLRALAIVLLGFLLHYLVRNVEARDTTIARYRKMLDTLAGHTGSLHDPRIVRRLVMDICRVTRSADCCAMWTLDRQEGRLTLAACTREHCRHAGCPVADAPPGCFFLPLDDDRLPACVARSGEPHFASNAEKPPHRLVEALPAPRPFRPLVRLELGVPIPDFQPQQAVSRAVLCLAFDRPMRHQEMKQEYDAICELARYLSPTLYHASVLEQYQALQQLVQTVTHSLDRDRVIDTLLEQVTNVFGFDFATVSLVDETQGVIRTMRGRNVPDEWVHMAVHPLDSDDIQADVIRTGRTEILTGWDERFDRCIWTKFGHKDTVRVFVPMEIADPVTGQARRIGTLEAGYRKGERERISFEQVNLLHPFVAQAAIAVVNAQFYAQMQSKANALTALHDGAQSIQSAVWQSRRLLEQIGSSAEQVLDADIVLLFGYEEAHRQAELLFVGGDVHGKGTPDPRLGQGNILDAIIRERRPFYVPDAQHEPLLVDYGGADGHERRTFTQRQMVASFAGVPLLSGEKPLGIMCVNYRQPHRFSDDERRIIELFAQQAATALESARMRERDRKLTIARERTAFSRELHHSTSHDLFAIVLKARTALHHLERQDGRVTRELGDILDIAEKANRQLGYLLSEFCAPDLDHPNFQDVLQETAERIRRYYDIQVRCEGSGQAILSAQVHFALSRIIKEALNNTIRHARCQHVTVAYALSLEEVTLEIADDGVGFDPRRELRRKGKLGLKSMQEYARELGCPLELASASGQGTRVSVRFPLYSSVEGSLTCAPLTSPQ